MKILICPICKKEIKVKEFKKVWCYCRPDTPSIMRDKEWDKEIDKMIKGFTNKLKVV